MTKLFMTNMVGPENSYSSESSKELPFSKDPTHKPKSNHANAFRTRLDNVFVRDGLVYTGVSRLYGEAALLSYRMKTRSLRKFVKVGLFALVTLGVIATSPVLVTAQLVELIARLTFTVGICIAYYVAQKMDEKDVSKPNMRKVSILMEEFNLSNSIPGIGLLFAAYYGMSADAAYKREAKLEKKIKEIENHYKIIKQIEINKKKSGDVLNSST